MNERMNGNPAAPAAEEELPSIPTTAPLSAPAMTEKQAKDFIDAQLMKTIGIMVRGILVSSPGVQIPLLLPAIARVTGKMLATAVHGGGNTIEQTISARKDFAAAFDEGIRQVPLLQTGGLVKSKSPGRDFAPAPIPW